MNFAELVKEFEESNFWKYMGLDLMEIDKGKAIIRLKTKDEFKNIVGNLHGGAIMSLIDTSMGMSAKSLGAKKVATIQLEVRFIEPVEEGFIYATSIVIHELRNTCIIECRVTNEDGILVALSTSTFKK